jgi:AraC-like DNA-binding protein
MLSTGTLLRLCAAKERLRETAPRELSIAALARAARMSPSHFIRRFAAVFGETPHQYRRRATLDRARLLLAAGELSVTDVCLEVGFASLGSFSDAFARRFGVAPSTYRRRVRVLGCALGTVPPELVPDCLTLMTGVAQFSRSAAPQSCHTDALTSDSARQRCASSSRAFSSTTKTRRSPSTRTSSDS